MEEILHFRVSSGLKNIIGRELINDKYIAIFELVKNSYDAGAKNVTILFKELGTPAATITIKDDGNGMSKEDIINKWLFVAYSEKRNPSYRDKIKRSVAGAKGVGRFSCDRLGQTVVLESKTGTENLRHRISIKWSDFEKNSLDNFTDIDVHYSGETDNSGSSGTSIVIAELREDWDRSDLLSLKKALTQMVNPSATSDYDQFEILLQVPSEKEKDNKEKEERNRINGIIKNNVFKLLNEKTTKITVGISSDGKTITTELVDRGIYLFKTVEKNEFSLRNVYCELFFLNRSAKNNFTRVMGVDSINYGSVFVYKNGFRIYPYGEPGQDFFDIDERKQQGYKRFLGTRELIGRIVINGDYNNLIETSSRNNGFINSPHLVELRLLFTEYVLKPLEKYVVQVVQWGDTDSFLDSAKENNTFNDIPQIIRRVKTRTKVEAYLSIEYNKELPQIILRYKTDSSKAIDGLRELASASNNDELLKQAEKVEKKTKELEKLAHEANAEAQNSHDQLDKAKAELAVTKKQIGILDARADLTAKEAIDAMHIMKGYADAIDSVIAEIFEVAKEENIEIGAIKQYLSSIGQICEKIMNSYNIVMRTNYTASSDNSHDDIVQFVSAYIVSISQPLNISINNLQTVNQRVKFNPLELSIVLDNIISNSCKANASNLVLSFEDDTNGVLLRCTDDGYGLNPSANPSRLFEPGYSTTNGSGIGMSTIKKYIEKVGGSATYNPEYKAGFEVLLYLKSWT